LFIENSIRKSKEHLAKTVPFLLLAEFIQLVRQVFGKYSVNADQPPSRVHDDDLNN